MAYFIMDFNLPYNLDGIAFSINNPNTSGYNSGGVYFNNPVSLQDGNLSIYPVTTSSRVNIGSGGAVLYRHIITIDAPSGLDLTDPTLLYPTTFDTVWVDPITVLPQEFTQDFLYVDDVVCPPADLTICTECRQSNQQACGETYFIEAGLTSGDTYYAAITDRNNDVYIQAIIADANGNLTIDALAPEFPVGFWLAESGNKSITVYEDEEMTIVSELTVGVNVYTCMILTLQYMYTTTSGLIPDFAFYVSDTLDFYVDNSSNTYIA
jgi:hypothetical protein